MTGEDFTPKSPKAGAIQHDEQGFLIGRRLERAELNVGDIKPRPGAVATAYIGRRSSPPEIALPDLPADPEPIPAVLLLDELNAEPVVSHEMDGASEAGRKLAGKRHRASNEEKARIADEADPLIQRGTLNHVQIAKEVCLRGSWLLTPVQIKSAVKERCIALGRTDLIQGHPDYHKP